MAGFIDYLNAIDPLFHDTKEILRHESLIEDIRERLEELSEAVSDYWRRAMSHSIWLSVALRSYEGADRIEQLAVEIDGLEQHLKDHPAYPYRKAVGPHGVWSDDACRKHFGQPWDELAKSLGYEDGYILSVGKPPSHTLMPDEQLRHDVLQIRSEVGRLKMLEAQLRGLQDEVAEAMRILESRTWVSPPCPPNAERFDDPPHPPTTQARA